MMNGIKNLNKEQQCKNEGPAEESNLRRATATCTVEDQKLSIVYPWNMQGSYFRRILVVYGFALGVLTFALPIDGFQGVTGFSVMVCSLVYLRVSYGEFLVGSLGSCIKYFLFGVSVGVDIVPIYQVVGYCVKGIEGYLLDRSHEGVDLKASVSCALADQFSLEARCYDENKFVFPGAQYLKYRAALWTHIITSLVALLLGIFLFYTPFRRSYRRLHRYMGRLYVCAVLIGSCGSFWLGITSEGGMVVNVVYSVVSVFWFTSVLIALQFAIRRDIVRHKAWMVRNYWGVTWGSVSLRWQIQLVNSALQLPFHVAYPIAALTSIVPAILLVEYYIHWHHYPAYAQGLRHWHPKDLDDDVDLEDLGTPVTDSETPMACNSSAELHNKTVRKEDVVSLKNQTHLQIHQTNLDLQKMSSQEFLNDLIKASPPDVLKVQGGEERDPQMILCHTNEDIEEQPHTKVIANAHGLPNLKKSLSKGNVNVVSKSLEVV